MSIPEHIKKLVEEEIERNKDIGGTTLSWRKNRTDDSCHALDEKDERVEKILGAWDAFHASMPYTSLKEFYCKSALCSWLKPGQLSEDLFIQLITDRDFLFLEYNEHSNDPEYPPLRCILESPKLYLFRDLKEDETRAAAAEKMVRNSEKVREQGFVPTGSHYSAYKKWQDHIKTLDGAIKHRRNHLKRYKLEPDIDTQSISVPIRKGNAVTDMDKRLAGLFLTYLKALSEYAYEKNYATRLDGNDRDTWSDLIHSVVHYLDEHPEVSKDRQALFLFQLLSGNTKKLADGKLRIYHFRPPQRKRERGVPPQKSQTLITQKIRCNIMLYDYLLRLFPPEDLGYAKFQFYAFTGYDWYTHYELPEEIDWTRITFNLPADLSDGVDELGHLLRQNIWFCMPNSFGWLVPSLPNNPDVDAQVLATLLMHDATLPTKSQLVSKVRNFIESEEGKTVVSKYREIQFRQMETRHYLEDWCKSKNLAFRHEEILFDEKRPNMKKRLKYSRYVLERGLKEALYQEARENLGKIALGLFGDLFISGGDPESAFDFTGLKYI